MKVATLASILLTLPSCIVPKDALSVSAESYFYSSAYGIPFSSNVVEKVVATNTHGISILSTRDMVMADVTFNYDVFYTQHNQMYLSDKPQYVILFKLRVSLKTDVKYANGLGGWFTEKGNAVLEDVSVEFAFDNWGDAGVQNYISYPFDPIYIDNYVYTINPALNTNYIDAIDYENSRVNNLSGRYVFSYLPYFDETSLDAYGLTPLNQPTTKYNIAASKDAAVSGKAVVDAYFMHPSYPSNGEDILYYGMFCVVPPDYVSTLNLNIRVSVLTTIAKGNFWGECVKYGFIEEKNIQLS